ncbi:hypothetical protein F5Y09DRAFT_345265 [Xylaria sp. FL1042]|nr:hypothetical protein F5Y09DRAFT_345265 [Xylaria sp. FL1042]
MPGKAPTEAPTATNQVVGSKRAKTSALEEPEHLEEEQKPRLTTPDLEFDYDQSQLRDPRPTPGRMRRPRLSERPKGRLNAHQKDFLYKEQALLDPAMTFHSLNVCHKNGPHGQPTYDSAGFQLDFEKVAGWMKPTPYSKSRAVLGMQKALARREREKREVFESFFVNGDGPVSNAGSVVDYVKDHIPKDLSIPWHQIDAQRAHE